MIVKTHLRIFSLSFFPLLFLHVVTWHEEKQYLAWAEDGDESEWVASKSSRKKEIIQTGKWEWVRGSGKPLFSLILPLVT